MTLEQELDRIADDFYGQLERHEVAEPVGRVTEEQHNSYTISIWDEEEMD